MSKQNRTKADNIDNWLSQYLPFTNLTPEENEAVSQKISWVKHQLLKFVKFGEPCENLVISMNPNTSSAVLAVLSKDENRVVRINSVIHPNTSSDVLAVLAQDQSEFVREFLCYNPNTSSDVLAVLAQDTSEDVRKCVPYHPNTSIEVLRNMLEDCHPEVVDAVAEAVYNPSTRLTNMQDFDITEILTELRNGKPRP